MKRPAAEVARERAASRDVEPWWQPDPIFPARAAEGSILAAMLGLATWGVATLIPELCLQFVADASIFGAAMLGILVALIAGLPGVALGLFVVGYALQYLGRVVIASAMGEVLPPRPPDRNYDGLIHGLGPWLVWLFLGASLGLGPLIVYLQTRTWNAPARMPAVLGLAAFGVPYSLMALLMTFVRDDGLPGPFAVLGALVRFPISFLVTCAIVLGSLLAGAGVVAAGFWLRDRAFLAYLVLMLPAWMALIWSAIVAMRALGVFYHHHASALRWHRKKPWWDVSLSA